MSSNRILSPKLKFRFKQSNYSILIVDRSNSINSTIFRLLSRMRYNCFYTSNIDEAKNIIKTKKIEYVLLDMLLPNNNSEELLELLLKKNIKIFSLIPHTHEELINLTYKNNIIDYIIKDRDMFHKMDNIDLTIEKLEKNKSKTILIVSDCSETTTNLITTLSNRNYNVIIENSTSNILDVIENKNLSVILFDLDINNENIMNFIKDNSNEITIHQKISIMVLSSAYNSSLIRTALNAGVVEIFQKPYLDEEIILKIDKTIDYYRKLGEKTTATALLSEYKDAVDERSIVSKSNINGEITFVNEQFCKLSGYSENELVGQSHNIIKHKDMESSVFKELWYTIKILKKTWRGKIKNKKKDGSYYWVDALIKPVLDKHGDIIEFIGLRTNITEMENYKEILKDRITDASKSLNENVNYTTQYEEAISEFTAVMKTDINNNITFINKEFSKISGYKSNELIGTNCELLRHTNHLLSKDSKHLNEALSNNEHMYITFTNVAKDGSLYFVDTVAYPITNGDGEVIEHLHLMHDVSELTNIHQEIEDTQKEIVYKMGEIGESRSKETGNHVKRVAEYSKSLALLHGLSISDANILFTASPMHDIGKVAISDSILKKPGKLTEEEFTIMKTHTTIGYEILKGSSRAVLKAASIVANEHHEKWNGQGYPKGLKKEEIHIYGRITAVADVFDALGSERCYKKAWSDEDIFKYYEKEKGEQFDPKLVDLFLNNKKVFTDIRNKYKDL
jgi:PAS domain S-box-containing protein